MYCNASYEPDYQGPAGLGCVLVDPDTAVRCYISEFIGRDLVASWNFAGSKHPIYEFELVAVLIHLKVFASYLPYKAVVVFTDNEGALGSLGALSVASLKTCLDKNWWSIYATSKSLLMLSFGMSVSTR